MQCLRVLEKPITKTNYIKKQSQKPMAAPKVARSLLTSALEGHRIPYDDIKTILHKWLKCERMEHKMYTSIVSGDGKHRSISNHSWCFSMVFPGKYDKVFKALCRLDNIYYNTHTIPDLFNNIKTQIFHYLSRFHMELRASLMFYSGYDVTAAVGSDLPSGTARDVAAALVMTEDRMLAMADEILGYDEFAPKMSTAKKGS